MITKKGLGAAWLVIFIFSGFCMADISAVDDAGNTLRLDQPAQRIVSLAPHITEFLFAAGAGKQIVAVTAFSDYPPAARDILSVGDSSRLDREKLLLLRPDLVVAWGSGTPASEIEALQQFGIPVFISEPRHLDSIPSQLETFGVLTGHSETAINAARKFRGRLQSLRARHAGKETVKVFFQVAGRPIITINGEHMISAVIELCGGRNLFAELPGLAPSVSLEAVIALAPEIILYSEYPGHGAVELSSQWDSWQVVPAVSKGQIYGVPVDLINRPGPRILEGAARICKVLDGVGEI